MSAARRWILVFGTVLLAAFSAPLTAQDDATLARQLRESGRVLSLEHFVQRARVLRPGRLVEARLREEPYHGGWVYEIFMLDAGGRIWEIEFDAATGKLVEHERMR